MTTRLRALLSAPLVRSNVAAATALYLLRACCTLSIPICVYFFILWAEAVDHLHRTAPTASPPLAAGLLSAAALALASVLSYYAEAAYMLRVAAAGLAARTALAADVFAAVLARRLGAAPALNSGEVHNLHGVDTAALEHGPDALLTLALQPLEILGIVLLLVWFVGGPAAGGAVAAVLFNLALTIASGLAAKALDGDRTAAADRRVRALSEFLGGMRAVKLLGWEGRFAAAIAAARAAESALYARATPFTGLVNVASSNGIDLISVGLLLVYVYAQGLLLSPSMVFVYWVLLAALHGRIFHFPIALSEAREAVGAWGRLVAFLGAAAPSEALPSEALPSEGKGGAGAPAIALQGASITWPVSAEPTISDATFHLAPGSCTAIAGPVASGKTTLLLALLGELPLAQGSSSSTPAHPWSHSIGYVPQAPWTLPTSVRDNILLGRPWEPQWYAAVVAACCLEEDFLAWPEGDLSHTSSTILSGGQRVRVALARAAYGRPALFLADDAFAALDASVGRRVVEALVCGEGALLAGSTRLLVTSSTGVMERADGVITLCGDGRGGSVARLVGVQEAVAALASAAAAEVVAGVAGSGGVAGSSSASPPRSPLLQATEAPLAAAAAASKLAHPEPSCAGAAAAGAAAEEAPAAPLLGRLQSLIAGCGGPWFFACILLGLVAEACFVELSVLVITKWSNDPTGQLSSVSYYFSAYLIFVGAEFLSAYARQLCYGAGTRAAADAAHAAALQRLQCARMAFFDSASTGSILSAFGRDLSDLDKGVWYATEYFLLGLVYSGVVVLTNLFFTPYTLLAAVPPAGVFLCCHYYYHPPPSAGRQQQQPPQAAAPEGAAAAPLPPPAALAHVQLRIKCEAPQAAAAAAAPEDPKVVIADHLSRCLEGGAVLRAFPQAAARFTEAHAALWHGYAAQLRAECQENTLQVRFFNLLGALYYAATVAIIIPCVLFKASFNVLGEDAASESSTDGSAAAFIYMSPGVAGLLLLNAAFASYMLQMLLQNGQALEKLRVARSQLHWHGVEGGRIACEVLGGGAEQQQQQLQQQQPPPGWPSSGHLVLSNVRLTYGPQLPLVLRGVALEVRPGRKVAVVGRTGAGKSSLVAALARLVEPEAGSSMVLDGVELQGLPLAAVRRAVIVVTQDALFFSGTLRSNLDPFAEFSDAQLQGALEAVGLGGGAGAGGPGQAAPEQCLALGSAVGERGAGLSAGQCQLVSLARALLRAPRLLVLDEATATLDVAAEEMVLGALRRGAFERVACLVIAHRLQCVVECDSVCVMEGGVVVEMGTPWALLQRSASAFAALVRAAPASQQQALRDRAKRVAEGASAGV